MKRIFVVVDVDNAKALKAFRDERRAEDYAAEYYYKTGIDTRPDLVWFDEITIDED